MAQIKDFLSAAALAIADLIAVSQNGLTRKVSLGDLKTFITQDVNASLSDKANNTDNTRTTIDKSVTGAINELNANKVNKTDFTNSLVANGWQKLPNGSIEQWGLAQVATGGTITFPIAFNNSVLNIVCTGVDTTPFACAINGGNSTGFTIYHNRGVASYISWRAIGK